MIVVDRVVTIPLMSGGSADAKPERFSAERSEPPGGDGPFLAGPENLLVEVAVADLLGGNANRYNPLLLHGPTGTGKSHLARGLVRAWRERYGRRSAVYTTGADFVRELTDAIEVEAIGSFRDRYHQATLFVLEDLGQLQGKQASRETARQELRYLVDTLLAAGGQVVVTCAMPPVEMHWMGSALTSRLLAGLVVGLKPAGAATRQAAVRRFAESRGLQLSQTAAQMLADDPQLSLAGLFGALMHLELSAATPAGVIDAPAVRGYLQRHDGRKQLEIKDIAQIVAQYYGLRVGQLRSGSRRRAVVHARAVAMYLARCTTAMSFGQIGEYFAGRDHSTVMHGCRKVESLIAEDKALRGEVEELRRRLSTGPTDTD